MGEKWPLARLGIAPPLVHPPLLQPIFAPLAHLVQLVVDDKGAAGDAEEADEKTRQEDDAHQLATSISSRAAFK